MKQHADPNSLSTHDSLQSIIEEDRKLEVCSVASDDAEGMARNLAARLQQASVELEVLPLPPSTTVFMKSLGINKAFAIQRLCDHLDRRTEDILAFGDGVNDIEMIQIAGCGIAMANATAALKEVAHRISPWTNAEEAVAQELIRLKGYLRTDR